MRLEIDRVADFGGLPRLRGRTEKRHEKVSYILYTFKIELTEHVDYIAFVCSLTLMRNGY